MIFPLDCQAQMTSKAFLTAILALRPDLPEGVAGTDGRRFARRHRIVRIECNRTPMRTIQIRDRQWWYCRLLFLSADSLTEGGPKDGKLVFGRNPRVGCAGVFFLVERHQGSPW